jgi:hypothetical protein
MLQNKVFHVFPASVYNGYVAAYCVYNASVMFFHMESSPCVLSYRQQCKKFFLCAGNSSVRNLSFYILL